MRIVDTILHWLVRIALAAGLVTVWHLLRQGAGRSAFSSANIGPSLFFGSAWLVPALELGTWSNAASGRQSILFYVLSVIAIALIATLGLVILVYEGFDFQLNDAR